MVTERINSCCNQVLCLLETVLPRVEFCTNFTSQKYINNQEMITKLDYSNSKPIHSNTLIRLNKLLLHTNSTF